MLELATGRDKDARDEVIYRHEYVLRLSEEPEELAEFLLATDELDAFVEVDTEERSKTIENAVVVFSENEDIHQKALKRAKEVFAEMHIDCNWEELRKIAPRSDDFETHEEYKAYMEQNHPTLPLATIAETGEPISSEPAGFWLPPEDFLTDEEREFREQVIEAAELDKNAPDFTEKLTRIYAATNISEYPNYETYRLFMDRRIANSK